MRWNFPTTGHRRARASRRILIFIDVRAESDAPTAGPLSARDVVLRCAQPLRRLGGGCVKRRSRVIDNDKTETCSSH